MTNEKRIFEVFLFGLGFKVYSEKGVDSKDQSRSRSQAPTLGPKRAREMANSRHKPAAKRLNDEEALLKDAVQILESQPEIRSVFGWRSKRMASIDLAEALRRMPGGRWSSITPSAVARALRRIDIPPRSLRFGAKVRKGYFLQVSDNKQVDL